MESPKQGLATYTIAQCLQAKSSVKDRAGRLSTLVYQIIAFRRWARLGALPSKLGWHTGALTLDRVSATGTRMTELGRKDAGFAARSQSIAACK